MTVPDDPTLMRAIAHGDEDALRKLYERHAAATLRLLRRLSPSVAVAEELLQETWLAVWQSAGRFRGDSSVRGWLLGVARRQAHNVLRRKEFATVDLEEAHAHPDERAGTEAQVLAGASRGRIVAAIKSLPDIHREVVVLALVEELPYRDVSAVLGVPVGTVKSRMSHARAALARALAEERVQP
jgi:RNA polymerase sigma-70 factor (ECF subfamily)